MFRLNPCTHHPALFSDLNLLSAHQRKRLDQSWAGTFRREVFERLDERAFAGLYNDIASRPNVPINVLVGLRLERCRAARRRHAVALQPAVVCARRSRRNANGKRV